MIVEETDLPGVLVLTPTYHNDERGFFYESFNTRVFRKATNLDLVFAQDNHSCSSHGVLRGLHYQIRKPQGKLVRVIEGEVFDVAVDIRKGSPTFGKWTGIELSAENKKQLWVPPDFAHGFLVISEKAQVLYKATDYYAPQNERCIRWDDTDIGIVWPEVTSGPVLSNKDQMASTLRDAEVPLFPK